MLNKVAEEVKEAEVRGVEAAFCDSGLVKVASAEDFDDLVVKVASLVGDSYTIEDIANATDVVLSGGLDKEAEEIDTVSAASDIIGTAYIMKVAGDISEDDFENFSDSLLKEAAKAPSASVFKKYLDVLTGGNIRRAMRQNKINDKMVSRKMSIYRGKTKDMAMKEYQANPENALEKMRAYYKSNAAKKEPSSRLLDMKSLLEKKFGNGKSQVAKEVAKTVGTGLGTAAGVGGAGYGVYKATK